MARAAKKESMDEQLGATKISIVKASKVFGVPPERVTLAQFNFLQGGAKQKAFYDVIGGFAKVRNYLFPTQSGNPAEIKAMKRLLRALGKARG